MTVNINNIAFFRRRGGKRAKYLAYRAQQKEQQLKELAIFQQQQAIAFDNYNTVPMDIDNDDDCEYFVL